MAFPSINGFLYMLVYGTFGFLGSRDGVKGNLLVDLGEESDGKVVRKLLVGGRGMDDLLVISE